MDQDHKDLQAKIKALLSDVQELESLIKQSCEEECSENQIDTLAGAIVEKTYSLADRTADWSLPFPCDLDDLCYYSEEKEDVEDEEVNEEEVAAEEPVKEEVEELPEDSDDEEAEDDPEEPDDNVIEYEAEDSGDEEDEDALEIFEEAPRLETPKKPVFSINDRFRFIRSLFGGSADSFNSALADVAALESYDEAEDLFLGQLEWNPQDPDVEAFLNILKKYFS